MEYLILDGNPDPADEAWESYLGDFAQALKESGADACVQVLRDLDIRYCTGCWSCWWATPGVCSHRDDMVALYPRMVRAHLTVWASPLVLGNVSACTKKAQDRFIPLVHPYIELSHGECHHRRRYPRDFDMGLIIQTGPEDTAEDVAIVRHQHERLALNGRGALRLFATTACPAQEAAHEALGA